MQGTKKTDVVTIGESMVLFQPLGEKGIRYEPLYTKSLAGAESNVALALTRLGKKVSWISKLGPDPFGDFILATLAGEGVDVSHVKRDGEAPTAVYFKDVKSFGDPTVYYYRKHSAASRLEPSDVQEEWFSGSRHLHMTGITPALSESAALSVRKAMEVAKEMGLSISFDPNLRRKLWDEEEARQTLLSLIPLCDVFLPGLDEAEFLLGKRSVEEYGEAFLQMGAKVVVLKLGAEGSIGFIDGEAVEQAPYRVSHVVDSVGAGDAFAAGFLSVYLDEDSFVTTPSLRKALARANQLGALATQFKGDWEGIPSISELNAIESGNEVKR
ncbi:sugar kinase [Pullulanibacillus sp. KACC 23026]|uniref:sugar kinase n=1 Tax=Pullulanibacillus sp. KACC 23026 TaxID=3028315 RepID=UPI0023B0FD3E|nr:sugar kinase [Pullulanibacillus sp. KACC 23026]WEG13685.1 sugar kinase [Pullulanibacillus sp. KACC 23026]